jgi:hypothetical protein
VSIEVLQAAENTGHTTRLSIRPREG